MDFSSTDLDRILEKLQSMTRLAEDPDQQKLRQAESNLDVLTYEVGATANYADLLDRRTLATLKDWTLRLRDQLRGRTQVQAAEDVSAFLFDQISRLNAAIARLELYVDQPYVDALKADAVFEGSGVKGIALVGALEAFEEAGFCWENVAGVSTGAMIAALVAAGYDASELNRLMHQVDFRKFMDTGGISRLPVLGPTLSLVLSNGLYRGDYLLNLMRELLGAKVGKERVTFADLVLPSEVSAPGKGREQPYKYRLTVVASDISTNRMLILPQDITHLGFDPDELEVALAVRMSMSIPFFFRPVIVAEGTNPRNKHWIVDGGILSNFPVFLFDRPPGERPAWPTFGFLVWDSEREIYRHRRIRGPVSMLAAIVNTMAYASERKFLTESDLRRVVQIPTGHLSAMDFDLSEQDRNLLYVSGYQTARGFLRNWSAESAVPSKLSP